jgi:hypothetical protein
MYGSDLPGLPGVLHKRQGAVMPDTQRLRILRLEVEHADELDLERFAVALERIASGLEDMVEAFNSVISLRQDGHNVVRTEQQ